MDTLVAALASLVNTLLAHPWALMAALLGPEFVKRFIYPVVFRRHAHRLPAATLKLLTVIQPPVFATLVLYGQAAEEVTIRGPVIGLAAIAVYMGIVGYGESAGWKWAADASAANRILEDFSLPDEVDPDEVGEDTVFGRTKRGA